MDCGRDSDNNLRESAQSLAAFDQFDALVSLRSHGLINELFYALLEFHDTTLKWLIEGCYISRLEVENMRQNSRPKV